MNIYNIKKQTIRKLRGIKLRKPIPEEYCLENSESSSMKTVNFKKLVKKCNKAYKSAGLKF